MASCEPRLTRHSKRRLEEPRAEEGEACTICLDPLKKHDVTMLPCGHAFHAKCMMETILKHNVKCHICRTPCARALDQDDDSSEGEMDENTILTVADRIQEKLAKEDVSMCLTRFHLLNGLKGLTYREKCELLAEQLTHETDDEDNASE
eukprot:1730833-Prymnesium_polylepis.2